MYITKSEYEQYTGVELSPAEFARSEYRAERVLDAYTMGRLKREDPLRESAKRCMAELINVVREQAQAEARSMGVRSVSNDGVSVAYAGADVLNADASRTADNIVSTYLAGETDANGTLLLYRGLR